ncbi:unnamed protein product, partial [Rotaria sp. Silwood2]
MPRIPRNLEPGGAATEGFPKIRLGQHGSGT